MFNPVPYFALAVVASGYAVAVDRTNDHFDTLLPELTTYAATAGQTASVYDVLAHGSQPMDEPHCEADATLAATLRDDFAEAPVEQRVAADGLKMQLWASDIMGTWTMVHRGDDGITCIVSSGTGWISEGQTDQVFAAVPFAS